MPRGTGLSNVSNVSPSRETPAFGKQKVALFQKLHMEINHVLI